MCCASPPEPLFSRSPRKDSYPKSLLLLPCHPITKLYHGRSAPWQKHILLSATHAFSCRRIVLEQVVLLYQAVWLTDESLRHLAFHLPCLAQVKKISC